MFRIIACFFAGALLMTAPAFAQSASDTNMEILKEKLKADKKLLVAGNMDLTDAEAKHFWPVYESYQKDLEAVNKQLFKTIKDYAEAYNKGTVPNDTARNCSAKRYRLRSMKPS